MGKRVTPPDRPGLAVQLVLRVTGLACYLIGGLWVLLFLGLLIFGGLDWRAEVANGMGFQGPVILGLGALGLFWFVGGGTLLDRAGGRGRRRTSPAPRGDD